MYLHESWEPTFPPGYKAEVRGSARSSEQRSEAPRIQSYSVGANITHPPNPPNTHTHPRGGWRGVNSRVTGEGDIINSMVYPQDTVKPGAGR